MQKQFLIIFVVAFAIVGALIYVGRGSKLNILLQREMTTAVIGGEMFNLEVVRAPETIAKGLAGRDSIGDREGMLFMFDKQEVEVFWMKGMKFPIDIIWIKGDKIVGIERNIAIIQTTQDILSAGNIPVYPSPDLVDKVIEIKSGTADELKLNTGDNVQINFAK